MRAMTPARRTHAEARAQMRAGIIRLGNEQLARVGAAGLSVREIARGLGVASSAIYRHVAHRDALLTLLLVDAYTSLAEAALQGVDVHAGTRGDLARLARNVRTWATENPARWALAYGSPVPGYAAPAGETTGPGTRVMAAFLSVCSSGDSIPAVNAAPPSPVSAGLAAELVAGVAELEGGGSTLARAARARPDLAGDVVEAWMGLVGLVSAEVFGQLGPDLVAYGGEFLERWVERTALRFGLRP